MPFDNIEQAVLEAAQAEAARITAAAQMAATARTESEVEAARQAAERRYAAEARVIEEEFARRLIQHRGGLGKKLLERRNARLKEVFEAARQRILDGPPEEYASVMGSLLRRAASEAGGRVRVHPEDRGLFESLVADINRERPAEVAVQIDDDDPLPRRGGFVFVSETFEVDQTVDTLLADWEHEMGPAIAAELFPGEPREAT